LVHDFGHKGIVNLKPSDSQEEETVKLLRNSVLNNLNKEDLELVTDLVLGTAPKNLHSINQRYLNEKNNVFYLMQSLINDADIAASFIDTMTSSLTRLILMESGNPNPSNLEIELGVKFFKQNFNITTEVAKKSLLSS
jgi:hypothetical protein